MIQFLVMDSIYISRRNCCLKIRIPSIQLITSDKFVLMPIWFINLHQMHQQHFLKEKKNNKLCFHHNLTVISETYEMKLPRNEVIMTEKEKSQHILMFKRTTSFREKKMFQTLIFRTGKQQPFGLRFIMAVIQKNLFKPDLHPWMTVLSAELHGLVFCHGRILKR